MVQPDGIFIDVYHEIIHLDGIFIDVYEIAHLDGIFIDFYYEIVHLDGIFIDKTQELLQHALLDRLVGDRYHVTDEPVDHMLLKEMVSQDGYFL